MRPIKRHTFTGMITCTGEIGSLRYSPALSSFGLTGHLYADDKRVCINAAVVETYVTWMTGHSPASRTIVLQTRALRTNAPIHLPLVILHLSS